MRTIYLDFRSEQDLETLRAELRPGRFTDARFERGDLAEHSYELAAPIPGTGLPMFRGRMLTDDEGTPFGELQFLISSIYRVDGNLWLSGNEFRINLTHYIAELKELAELESAQEPAGQKLIPQLKAKRG